MSKSTFQFGVDHLAFCHIDESVSFVTGVAKHLANRDFALLLDGAPVQAAMKCEPTGLPGALILEHFTKLVVFIRSDHATPADLAFGIKLGRTTPLDEHVEVKHAKTFLPGLDTQDSEFSITTFDGFWPDGFGNTDSVNVNDILQCRLFVDNPAATATVQVDAFVFLMVGDSPAHQHYVQLASKDGGEK